MKVILILAAALLAGCGPDMYASEWKVATDLCEPHGGIVAADSDYRLEKEGSFAILAFCADGTRAQRYFKK
jgi:hypothetical protein